jgi:hypothetical protein
MSSYRLSESFCAKAPLPGVILVAVAGLLIAPLVVVSVMASQPEINSTLQPIELLISLPIVLLVVCVALYFNYRRKRAVLQKFRLFLERDCLTRTGPGLADLSLFRDEVVEIVETQETGIAVFPSERGRGIYVPAGLIGYDEVRAMLSQWKDITARPKPSLRQWAPIGATVLLIGVGVATFVLESPYLVLPLGSAFIGFLLYSLWLIERSPQLNRRAKLSAWMVFFPIFSIVGKMALACGLIGQP